MLVLNRGLNIHFVCNEESLIFKNYDIYAVVSTHGMNVLFTVSRGYIHIISIYPGHFPSSTRSNMFDFS